MAWKAPNTPEWTAFTATSLDRSYNMSNTIDTAMISLPHGPPCPTCSGSKRRGQAPCVACRGTGRACIGGFKVIKKTFKDRVEKNERARKHGFICGTFMPETEDICSGCGRVVYYNQES